MAASRWIAAATSDEGRPMQKRGMRRIVQGMGHREPDADERGGPNDRDADDRKRGGRRMATGIVKALNEPVGY